jgi:hypothetical protein
MFGVMAARKGRASATIDALSLAAQGVDGRADARP